MYFISSFVFFQQLRICRAEVRRSIITTTVRDESQVTPPGCNRSELKTNGFRFYDIANLDKTVTVAIIFSANPTTILTE